MFDFVREEVGVLITYRAHWLTPPPAPAEADRGSTTFGTGECVPVSWSGRLSTGPSSLEK